MDERLRAERLRSINTGPATGTRTGTGTAPGDLAASLFHEFLEQSVVHDENGLLLGSTRHGFDTENSENARKFSELLVRTKSVKEAKEVLRNILLAKDDSSETGGGRGDFSRLPHMPPPSKVWRRRESVAIVAPIGCLNDGDDRIKEEEGCGRFGVEMFFTAKSQK